MANFESYGALERLAHVEPTDEELMRGERLVEALRGLKALQVDLGIRHLDALEFNPDGYLRIAPRQRVRRQLQPDTTNSVARFIYGHTKLPFVVDTFTFVTSGSGAEDFEAPVVAYSPRVVKPSDYSGSRYAYFRLDLAQHSVAVVRNPEQN